MLEGDLGDFSLPDILQLLAFTHKSGRLRIEAATNRGRVDLDAGRIRDASSNAARLPLARRLLGAQRVDVGIVRDVLAPAARLPTDLEFAAALLEADGVAAEAVAELLHAQMVDAVFDLLRWEEGSFRFDTDVGLDLPADAALPEGWSVEEVLTEAQQRLEDWPQVVERTGPGHAVATVTRPDDAAPTLPPDGWALLALVDGQRTLDELVGLSGQGEFATRRTLATLLDAGVVTFDTSGAAPVDVLLSAHRELAEIEMELAGATPAASAPEEPTVAATPQAGDADEDGAVTTAPEEPEPWEAPAEAGAEDEDEARQPATAVAEAQSADTGDEVREEAQDAEEEQGEVTPLRTGARRSDRLRTDPSVDLDLIERLIDGVENL